MRRWGDRETRREGGFTTDTDRARLPDEKGDGRRREKKELGKKGEEIAIRFLKKNGYRILLRNYVCKMGEMDIIAREKDTLVFVEVKTRTSTAFGPPQLAVNSAKQMQLSKVALYFLKEKRLGDVKARFDVVAILLRPKGEEIELIKDAFDLRWM